MISFNIQAVGDCWLWKGATIRDGVPIFHMPGKVTIMVRRILWEQRYVSSLGTDILKSTCGTWGCCYPEHFVRTRRGIGRRCAAMPRSHWFATNERGCWLWTGKTQTHGYGWLMLDGIKVLAHRQSYLMAHGELPNALDVLHECDTPPCCRPDHLRAGTAKDNSQDMAAKLRGPNKLTYEDVDTAKRLRASGLSLRKIAKQLHVCHKTVMKACKGQTYNYPERERPQCADSP